MTSLANDTPATLSLHLSQPAPNLIPIRNPPRFQNLILDLGDVLCFYSCLKAKTPLSGPELRQVLDTPIWDQYEKGQVTETQCYTVLEDSLNMAPGALAQTIHMLRQDLVWNTSLLSLVKHLKHNSDGQLRVFLMSNISDPDFQFVLPTLEKWDIFDGYFPSAHMGMRKPDLQFYQSVLLDADVDGESAIYVDDKSVNVASAVACGMQGVVFESAEQTIRELSSLFDKEVVIPEALARL